MKTEVSPVSLKTKSPAPGQILFAIGHSALGLMLVGLSNKGICLISLGDDPKPLIADLRKRFPNDETIKTDLSENPIFSKVFDFVESPGPEIPFPIDLRGTDFQQQVWSALLQIPFGKTSTYTEIAAQIGRPKAFRAVAAACGANPVAIAVPCHRVLRSDGSISGYRWGKNRKKQLLEREQG